MISNLKGVVQSIDFSEVVIEVGGIGYGVNMSVPDVASLKIGQAVEVLIVEIIREQSFDLYGFLEAETRVVFEICNKVNGVGPRTALALIGIGDAASMRLAVGNGDSGYFARAPGVGPKLAERLCVELKGKLDGFVGDGNLHSGQEEQSLELEAALTALGFKSNDIQRMAKTADRSMPIEEQVRQALKER